MKKLFLFLLLLVSGVVLVGCGETLAIDEQTLGSFAESIETMEIDNLEEPSTHLVGIDSDYSIIETYTQQGAVMLSDSAGNRGIYSLYLEDYIIEPSEEISSITMLSAWRYQGNVYFRSNYSDGENAYYDLMGREILPRDYYYYTHFSISENSLYDENNQFVGYEYYEYIEYETNEGYFVETYLIDKDSRINVDEIDSETEFQVGDRFDIRETYSLDDYGLEGHEIYFGDVSYRVFNEDGELISTFLKPPSDFMTDNPLKEGQIFNGVLMYQTYHEMPESHDDYDFIIDGEKYILNTYVIDLTDGSRSSVDAEYVIFDYHQPFPDEDGNKTYGLVSAFDVTSGIAEELERELIINSRGDIVNETSGMRLHSLRKLSEGFYYNQSTRTVYDSNLDPRFELSNNPQYIFEDSFIFQHNNHFGIVDYEGNVQVPFDYSNLELLPNQNLQAQSRSGERVIINRHFEVNSVPSEYTHRGQGIYTYMEDNESDYTFNVYDHTLEPIYTIDTLTSMYQTHNMNTAFYSGILLTIYDPLDTELLRQYIVAE